MSKKSLESVLQYLRRVALTGHGGASDAHLLESFARQRDEAAFEKLVFIHGPMVLGLCRRLVRHEQDAEDAFQATFLTLARKAGTISNRESLGSWLYKVAHRVACRTRGGELTNRMAVLDRAGAQSEADATGSGLHAVLDEEIARLTDAYRRPIVLCYLQGKTHEEAARLLGCPKGTVASRMARAKDQLRRRLSRRGWALSTGVLASMLTDKVLAVPVPAGLVGSTLAYVSGNPSNAGALSAKVLALSEGVIRIMWLNKMKMVVGVVVGLVLTGAGVGLVVRQTWADNGQGNLRQAHNDPQPKNAWAEPNVNAQDDSKTEIADLRKEIAGLRKEIKSLQDALRQSAASPESTPRYRGKPLSYWMDQSKDADPKYRREAVEALGMIARINKLLIPVVVGILNRDDDDSVRFTAANALGQLEKERIPLLLDVLRDKSSRGRLQAARTLGELGDVEVAEMGAAARAAAVPVLTQILLEEDRRLLGASVQALARMGDAAKPAIPALIDVLGRSLQTIRNQPEFEAWSRGKLPGISAPPVFSALFRIDPEIRELLPEDFDNSFGSGTPYGEGRSQWRKAYGILKAKYQKEK
jgi:RNA polymerase sigma factor (sigma-70 family)